MVAPKFSLVQAHSVAFHGGESFPMRQAVTLCAWVCDECFSEPDVEQTIEGIMAFLQSTPLDEQPGVICTDRETRSWRG